MSRSTGRRTLVAALAALAGGGALGAALRATAAADEAEVIRLAARRFAFEPARLVLTRGKPAVIELVSLDRVHGFRVPGLGLRADAAPGEVRRLPVTPAQAGFFPMFCDVFCGEGHDDMEGTIEVHET
jgi:cytochrome c oxidase subunit II